ncbi:MAG TPA: YidB family protein [Acidobacteriaceae bacterium]|jgi:uncharacterized protein YidB (DUF937 family)|nr:YidB family protein [Acidobacteriaceae bacterium]
MGFLNAIEGMVNPETGTNAKVAGGLLQALDEHPGGLGGLIGHLQNNGMGDHVQQWSTGQQTTATPDQIQQGLGNTGLIDTVAAKAGVSPQTAKMAMAVILPMVIAHFTQGGQQTPPPQGGLGSMASQILGRLL